jgi:hypothetical protein
MKISAEEIRELYAEMSDLEFRSLNRGELTDVAQQCYDAEAARRPPLVDEEAPEPPLETPVPPPGPKGVELAPEDLEQEIMVPVAAFEVREEAKDARAVLESASIPCCLALDRVPPPEWTPSNGLGALLLLVPASYTEEAREVLAGA